MEIYAMNAIVPAGNTALTPTSMESAIQLAEMMARGKLVPSHLHNSPGDCLMVIEASMRWQMSPFAVAQCTSVIQGKLMFEGKLVAAALNASGILSSRLDYEFTGKGNERAVSVRGTLKGETKAREVTVFLADAKTSNGMWTKQPDQQLVYAGTRIWARRHAPEVMLGVYAPEEFDRAEQFTGPTVEHEAQQSGLNSTQYQQAAQAAMNPYPAQVGQSAALDQQDLRTAYNAEVPMRAAAAATQRAERVVDPTVYDTAPQRTDEQWQVWLDKLKAACAVLYRRSEVVEVGERATVGDALATGPQWVQREISAILAENYKRFPEEPEAPQDEVEIRGEEKLAAG